MKIKIFAYWNDEIPQKANLIDSNPFESLAWVVNLKLSQNTIIQKEVK